MLKNLILCLVERKVGSDHPAAQHVVNMQTCHVEEIVQVCSCVPR
jgi:hypothetical protein